MKNILALLLISAFCGAIVPCPVFSEQTTPLSGYHPEELAKEPLPVEPKRFALASPTLSAGEESSACYTVPDSYVVTAQSSSLFKEEEPFFERQPAGISDPLEPLNRIFFEVNDRLYFWLLKPVATGYKAVVPQGTRIGVQNFFSNASSPIRFFNCILQANVKGAGNELIRFLFNTAFGLAGFLDPASSDLGIEKREEDFGQTLGVWGLGPLFYIEWPILGPSSLRDTVGFAADIFLQPQTYLISSIPVRLAVESYDIINHTSLRIGEYENFKGVALDPYVAKRDAYYQNRVFKIKERK